MQKDEKYYRHDHCKWIKNIIAKSVVRFLCKKIAETGHDVYGEIYENNKWNRSFADKIGFKEVGELRWIRTNIQSHSTEENLFISCNLDHDFK